MMYDVIVIFYAGGINVRVAFVPGFLTFIVLLSRSNSACSSFLESHDCVGHVSSSNDGLYGVATGLGYAIPHKPQ